MIDFNNRWIISEINLTWRTIFLKVKYNPIDFNEDAKAIGLYNFALPKISKEEYINNQKKNYTNNPIFSTDALFIAIGICV